MVQAPRRQSCSGKFPVQKIKRLSNHPEYISDAGLQKLWLAAIRQAIDDALNGTGDEQLEAYHWLLTERSDLAFEIQGVYCEDFREDVRHRLMESGFVLPQTELSAAA